MSASTSIVADFSLAPEGAKKIRWVAQHAPVLNAAFERHLCDGSLSGVNVAVCVPLEAKTAYLTLLLKRAGANVALAGTAPGYVQDDVAAAIAQEGVIVFADARASAEEFEEHLTGTIRTDPALLVDDRGELTRILHTKERSRLTNVRGATEQTTSGVTKLRNMERDGILRYPVIAGNDAMCKHLFDNRYGTGQSVFTAILALTNMYVGGRTVVIAGYGWCGKGLARRAAGLQSRVVVCEVDPVRALEAVTDGYAVMPLAEAAEIGDFFVTSTGTNGVFHAAHFEKMKDGAVLANAGGLDTEIDVPALAAMATDVHEARRGITEYRLPDGRRLHLLAEGKLVNIAGGDGHPVEIMDLSFTVQALAIHYLARHHRELPPGVHPLPPEIDREIAAIKLETLGISIDALTEEQLDIRARWR